MAGYTRQSVADIIASAVIRAAPVNAEFNAVRDAFAQATGHTHDGSASEGAYVPLISDTSAFNKVVVDSTNNRISFYSDVSSVAVEQVRIEDGVFVPVTDNDVDLGSASAEFKDLYLDGIGYIDTLAVHENATVAGTLAVTGLSTLASVDIDAGTIDGTAIGSTTPAAGAFTTLSSTTGIASNLIPSIDSTYTLGDASNYWSSAHIDAITTTGNVTVGGALSVTGTADFTNTTLNNVSDPTTAQQAATKAYVDAQVSGLVDAAPGALDTLNELAAAIGDDASFSTTVTNSIATKLPLAGGTMTGNIALGGYLINGAALTPTTASELTSKSYVDSILGSATAASDTAAAVEATYDAFDDRYLGSKTSAPTLDNDGDTLLTGALYWDSTSGGLYVWNGASWEIAGQRDELLQAIAATKTVTAVDVFVYDTSKDSDGGAWRKRTQSTSWYNETLNTATRGSRREFPAVAVIVAEAAKVTIYDGDDPSLPMWMVFNASTSNMLILGGGYSLIGGLSALNGVFTACSSGIAAGGLNVINLIADIGNTVNQYAPPTFSATYTGKYTGSVADRNLGLGFAASTGYLSNTIVNRTVNDVAMTVLPDAPIDSATGLPVPTIAVATAGGVSVIKDDGTVVDITGSLSGSEASDHAVLFDDVNRLWLVDRGFVNYGFYLVGFNLVPSADTTVSSADFKYSTTSSTAVFGNIRTLGVTSNLAISASASSSGLTKYSHGIDADDGMVAYTTSTYNTGWMNGDVKGAFLSDTDDTDLVGSGELVTNGTFDTDTSGWTGRNANTTLAVSSGKLSVSAGAADTAYAYQQITAEAGTPLVLTLDYFDIAGTSRVYIGVGPGTDTYYDSGNLSGDGSLTVTFTPTSANPYISLYASITATLGFESQYDNVYVILADADRSVNNNGLIINGTVPRTPVATGADLVAYGGFSASNYLEQPYNSDLDFGTGDFCVMGWVKGWNPAAGQYTVLSRLGTNAITFGKDSSSNKMAVFQSGRMTEINSVTQLDQNSWSHIAFVRSGSLMYLYINGAFDNSASMPSWNFDLADGVVQVGTYAGSQNNGGSIALLRISATAPTASQIAKIYNDEKVLFQENAQATLYGSSDAVTALAHDSDTNLLHVGTSAGRSVFQGLRRVSNTTTAVGTAISASNGLVVEE